MTGGRGENAAILHCGSCQWRSVAGRVEAAGRCRGAQPAVINHSFRTPTTQPPHPTPPHPARRRAPRVTHGPLRWAKGRCRAPATRVSGHGRASRCPSPGWNRRGLTTDGSADPCENCLSFCEDRWALEGCPGGDVSLAACVLCCVVVLCAVSGGSVSGSETVGCVQLCSRSGGCCD